VTMLEPRLITRRWVGQRHIMRSVRPPSPDRCGQRRLATAAEKMTLGVLPDEQRQFNPGQVGQQLVEPQRRTFTTWRHITTIPSPWIAVSHGNDRDTRFVIKDVPVHPHPHAQPLPARVIPRNAGSVHAQPGRLPHDQDAGRLTRTQHRPRAEREMCFARPAATDRRQQRVKAGIGCTLCKCSLHDESPRIVCPSQGSTPCGYRCHRRRRRLTAADRGTP